MPERKVGGGRRAKNAKGSPPADATPSLSRDERIQLLLATTSDTDDQSTRTKGALKAFGRRFKSWIQASAERAIIYAAVGFAVGWLYNAAVMAVGYNGYGKVPPGGPATGQGNEVQGAVFTFVATALIVAVVAHRRRVGGERFWADVRNFPSAVASLTRQDTAGGAVHLLWGFAGSMVVIFAIGPWITGALAVGFLVGIIGIFRSLITGMLLTAWQAVGRRVRPGGVPSPAPPAMVVAGLGGLLAVAVGLIVVDQPIQLLAAAAAAVGAFLLGRQQLTTRQAAMLLVGAVATAVAMRHPALAADGGYFECSGDIFNCPGIDQTASHAIPGGVAAALGAIAGAAIGDQAPPPSDPPVHPPCGQDGAHGAVSDWQKWQATHPEADGTPPTVGSENWREFMANRIEFHRQAADMKLRTEWDQPLDKLKGDVAVIDKKLEGIQISIKQAELRVQMAHDSATFGPRPWELVADNLAADFSSGEMLKRATLTGLKLPYAATVGTIEAAKGLIQLPEATGYAVGWWYQNLFNPGVVSAAYSEFGKTAVDSFTASMSQLAGHDISKSSDIISNVAGTVVGGEILSWGLGQVMGMAGKSARAGDLPASAGDIPAGGIPLDTAAKRAEVGHSEAAAKNLQAAADRNNVTPQLERRSPDAVANEGDSYMKSEGLKDLKSLNSYNGSVGGPGRESSALLGLFEPTPPPFWASKAVKEAYAEAQKVYDGIPGADIAAKRAYIESKPVTVYVDGVKQQFMPKFDAKGVLRNPENGFPVNTDYDGWDTLSADGTRSLGYNADGSKASAAIQSAERRAAVGFIKDAQRGAAQFQHSNRTRLWDPLPQLKWGDEMLPCFDCKLPNIAARKAAKVGNDGVVEYRPGSVDANGDPIPWLTQAHGTTPPPPTPVPSNLPASFGTGAGVSGAAAGSAPVPADGSTGGDPAPPSDGSSPDPAQGAGGDATPPDPNAPPTGGTP